MREVSVFPITACHIQTFFSDADLYVRVLMPRVSVHINSEPATFLKTRVSPRCHFLHHLILVIQKNKFCSRNVLMLPQRHSACQVAWVRLSDRFQCPKSHGKKYSITCQKRKARRKDRHKILTYLLQNAILTKNKRYSLLINKSQEVPYE